MTFDPFSAVVQRINRSLVDFRHVATAESMVITDGLVYIKRLGVHDTESILFRAIYPGLYMDTIQVGDNYFMVTRAAGSCVDATVAESREANAWAHELRRVHGLRHTVDLPAFDLEKILVLLHDKATLLSPKDALLVNNHLRSLPTNLEIENIQYTALLHGDPNFRNVAIGEDGTATLLDFDHALRGPIEWDVANVYMVCRIAGRSDMWRAFSEAYGYHDEKLVTRLYPYRLLDSFMFALLHRDFEGDDGIQARRMLVEQIFSPIEGT